MENIREVLEKTRDSGAHKVQLNLVHSSEFLQKYPDLMREGMAYRELVGERYMTPWGVEISLSGSLLID